MDLQLQGKRALVTGSTVGIGFATALGLAKEGATVVLNGRTKERVEEAVQRVQRKVAGAQVSGVAADLGTAEGVAHLLQQVPEVEILINNLGIFEPKAFENIEDEDWLRFFETNVLSGVRLTRHYLPHMKSRDWGRIIFVSSESALNIPAEMIHYGMTKTAQLAVARGVAETTVGTGVTVNSILPGPTSSEGVSEFVNQLARERGVDFATMEAEFFKTARPSSLLQRFITPTEVANFIVFVCSPLSSATNGATLRVEGGVVRSIA
ncbi:MAG: SDR family NAD(P)-dependent oxidoreductase [Abitibacteriaceae bacterium]|nr:SDR family NAD(P)-dependent oxidoreductase [Abditibacteriaceae bacterium]